MAAIGRSNYKQVLKKTERETKLKLDKALQATAIEAINRLIDRTPVDTGAAKFHWFMRLQPDERFDKDNTDPSGAKPKAGAKRDSETVQDRADSMARELCAVLCLSRGMDRASRHPTELWPSRSQRCSCSGRRLCRWHFRGTSDHRELRNRYIHKLKCARSSNRLLRLCGRDSATRQTRSNGRIPTS